MGTAAAQFPTSKDIQVPPSQEQKEEREDQRGGFPHPPPSPSPSSRLFFRKRKPKTPPPLPRSAITTQLSPEHATIFSPVITAILHRQYPAVFNAAQRIIQSHPNLLISPTTYSLLIEACALFPGSLMQPIAWSLFSEMQSRGLRPTSAVYHHLLRLLASSPDYLKRAQILREMKARWFTVSDEGWEWVIRGFLQDGQFESALDVVEKRVREGKGLGRDTWEELVVCLARAGEVEEAWRWMVHAREEVRLRWEVGEDTSGGEIGNRAWYELCTAAARALHVGSCPSFRG